MKSSRYLIDSMTQKDGPGWRGEIIQPVRIEIESKEKGRLRPPVSF
jgi:hypothetical protein